MPLLRFQSALNAPLVQAKTDRLETVYVIPDIILMNNQNNVLNVEIADVKFASQVRQAS
jgi:hypothetical protein